MLFKLALSFFLCLSWGSASPIAVDQRDVNPGLLSMFHLMKQYADAAYCQENNNSPGGKVSCHFNNCPLVQAENTTTIAEFENSLITDVTGFVATDHTNNLTIVSFRGSASIRSWLSDFIFPRIPVDICSGCTAHWGFWTSWVDARDRVLQAIRTAAARNPGFRITITGHSLGGAIASLAAAELRNNGYNVALYTFGAPRFGDDALSTYITNQAGGNYRVTHYNDPVPRVPPMLVGYAHISPEYYVSTPDLAPVTTADIRVCPGIKNADCNGAWIIPDILAHIQYFDIMGLCYPALDV
ncbi:Alpha/Beta hydrolase protein [Dactylonectria estremocensis]|uniref:Alpha/Beta hydrolase protein n=1 Tax=Dactylonectria estremocensis TaxID=1079267 RepID=A0A9P9IDD6_9HYPO|nr:Alpha/Beta hydrolase protein [Dactylonectria estremocensis]